MIALIILIVIIIIGGAIFWWKRKSNAIQDNVQIDNSAEDEDYNLIVPRVTWSDTKLPERPPPLGLLTDEEKETERVADDKTLFNQVQDRLIHLKAPMRAIVLKLYGRLRPDSLIEMYDSYGECQFRIKIESKNDRHLWINGEKMENFFGEVPKRVKAANINNLLKVMDGRVRLNDKLLKAYFEPANIDYIRLVCPGMVDMQIYLQRTLY